MKRRKKEPLNSIFALIVVLMAVGWTQKYFAHDVHLPTDCHGELIIGLKTDYLETEIDTVKASVGQPL